jgi:hypothetical protein
MTDDEMNFVNDPLILEIFLYKNNYKDRLLIAEMKEHAQLISYQPMNDNSFFIQADELFDILHEKFRRDISNFESTPHQELGPSVTSIYFLNSILNSYKNVKYLKVNISDSSVYSRKVDNRVSFDYRIVHSKVDLSSILIDQDLIDVKQLFINAGILKNEPFQTKPYFEIFAKDLITILSAYGSRFPEGDETNQLIAGIKALIGPKVELDNPTLLIIIDK